MLSYQHGYHAGNFADVIKHCTLANILDYLIQKDKPLFYLETHAGKGLYDLQNKQAAKTGEYREGIQLLWPDLAKLPGPFHHYVQLISELNPNKQLRYYPGSPWIASHMLRPQDRLYLCELHPNEFQELSALPHRHPRMHYSHSDGIASLNALLPPPEKRGLIFIDPSFEIKEEYKQIPSSIQQVFKRFSNGVFCLWYPIVNKRLTQQLVQRMEKIGAQKSLKIEFNLTLESREGMSGCGLWVINPPYLLADELRVIADTLKTYFNPGISSYVIETLGKD
jgi:23S rRNA (adenine2030-N6)-methyltransferase